jgi:hypothetical protein
LLIYRIWPHANGNQYTNNTTVFDEVYVYRPGGGYSNRYNAAAYSVQHYHSNFYKSITDPACVLTSRQIGSVGVFGVTPTDNGKIRFYVSINDTAPCLFTTNEYITIVAEQNSRQIPVYANGAYRISTDAGWLTAEPNVATVSAAKTSLSTDEITISAEANTGTQRVGRITLTHIDYPQIKQVVVVSQNAGNVLEVEPSSQTISGSAGSNAEYMITASVPYTATTTAAWVELSTNDSILTATSLTNNTGTQARQAIIRVSSGSKNINAILIQEVFDGTSIEKLELPTVDMYPNPTTGTIYVKADLKNASITDIHGEIVWSGKSGVQNTHQEISLENLPAGIYMLRIPNYKTIKILLTK